MAVAYDQRQAPVPPPPPANEGLGREFTLGAPASRFHLIAGGLVSFWDLWRPEPRDDRPPLLLTAIKMVAWVAAGIVVASAVGVGLGVLVVRLYAGTFG